MEFKDLLKKHGITNEEVLVFRHSPKEPELQSVLPWLAVEKPKIFNAYQQMQGPKVEKAMQKATFIASFIGHEPKKAVFIGLYKKHRETILPCKQAWNKPANVELVTKYGMTGMTGKQKSVIWFDLKKMDFYSDWMGKLVIRWPGQELSWWRWSANNEFWIDSITEDSLLDERMPEWNHLTLSWNRLLVIPKKWREELSRWRGIYFILDESDGKGYVGAAYGDDNIYGRWKSYAKSGHGGNKSLKGRRPENFRFSVLQILHHDMDQETVMSFENSWKDRLHTREFGLNGN